MIAFIIALLVTFAAWCLVRGGAGVKMLDCVDE